MKATEELKKEHKGIKRVLRILVAVSDKIEQADRIPHKDLDAVVDFLSVFVDRCHLGKEEDILFPAMEAVGIPRHGGPIGVLLEEHRKGREIVAKLKDAVSGYKSNDSRAASRFAVAAGNYVTLLSQHIDKEDNVLYPMADAGINSEKDAEMVEAFEKIERERIGPGKHEEFHRLLDRFEKAYLG